MALFWRIWAAVILVNLSVLTLFVALATLQFDGVNSALVGERLAVLADRTAAPFHAAAKIGLPLSTVRNAGALLERARQTDGAIQAIHVFDQTGRVVHSTVNPPPAAIPLEALAARKAADGAPWHKETGTGFFSSIDIPTHDGATAGGILIAYPAGGSIAQVRAMGAELALTAIAVLAISGGLGIFLLRLGLDRHVRMFEGIEADIADFERGAWRGAAGAPAPERDGARELRQLLGEAEARYRATGRSLADAGGDQQ